MDEFCPAPVPGRRSGDGGRCVAAKARIYGRVQGVGYRYWTRTQAANLSLRGYVRNLTDGSVEALFIGDAQSVARMLTFCEDGPSGAEVSHVDAAVAPPELSDEFDRFRRAPTRDPGAPV